MPDSVVLSADKALYIAKSEGRSCVRKVMMMAAPDDFVPYLFPLKDSELVSHAGARNGCRLIYAGAWLGLRALSGREARSIFQFVSTGLPA
jgi:hypothetical protein